MALPTFAKLMAAVAPDATNIDPADFRAWGLVVEATLNALLSRTNIINGYIKASVAANVLTIEIKTLAGQDPSVGDPVYIQFPNQAANTAALTTRALTAATNLVVSAGSTLGLVNNVPGRVWVVGFDDAATFRLGVFNAFGGNVGTVPANGGSIFPMPPEHVASATAEGGAGAADSAGVFYANAAVASKPFVILGHFTWETALAVAGNWSAVPDVQHTQRIGDAKPGDVVQVQDSLDAAQANGATTTPADDTIPQNTEGNQFMTRTITASSKANVFEIEHVGLYSASAAAQIVVALHQDAIANALTVRAQKCTALSDLQAIAVDYRMLAASVAQITFKIRAGGSAASTITFNGAASARLFGGAAFSRLTVRERVA